MARRTNSNEASTPGSAGQLAVSQTLAESGRHLVPIGDENAADGLTTQGDEALVMALGTGSNVRNAALVAYVSERTVYRRLNDPAFCSRVAEVREQLFDHAVAKLVDASVDAADRLWSLLDSEDEEMQLKAAKAILELGPRLKQATAIDRQKLNVAVNCSVG
jgi:hypothetical protein